MTSPAHILPRQPYEHAGPLPAGDLDLYAAQGYLIRPDTVAQGMRARVEQEMERLAADIGDADPPLIREPGGSIRSIFQPHLLSDLVAEMVQLDTVLPVPTSPRCRARTFFLVFNSVANQLTDPYVADRVRPEYLAARHSRSLGLSAPSA